MTKDRGDCCLESQGRLVPGILPRTHIKFLHVQFEKVLA